MTKKILFVPFISFLWLLSALIAPSAFAQTAKINAKLADYIVAIVQHEPVTYSQLQIQIHSLKQDYEGQKMPSEDVLRQTAMQHLVRQSALAQRAQEYGIKADPTEVQQVMNRVAAENNLTLEGLKKQLKNAGVPFNTFVHTVEQQLMINILREVTLDKSIIVNNVELDDFLEKNGGKADASERLISLAQVLIAVPEGATAAQLEALEAKAKMVHEKVKKIASPPEFLALVEQYSDDPNKEQTGGAFGILPASAYPSIFIDAVKGLTPGQSSAPIRTGAGYHILIVLDKEQSQLEVTQTHVRHILLKAEDIEGRDKAIQSLTRVKHQIETGQVTFDVIAKEQSQDASSAEGGDLGWAVAGMFVPEFETVMNTLKVGEVSAPVATRFGVHLIEVLERRQAELTNTQKREVARQIIHQQKVQTAYEQWAKEIENEAYIEYKEMPN